MGSPRPPPPLPALPSSPLPAPNLQHQDLASIVLEFQCRSENERPVNATRGWGTKEHLAPLGQLKTPFILAESSLIDPPHKGLVPVPGGGGGGGRMGGGLQLKANSLLCGSSLGHRSCLLHITVPGQISEIREMRPFPENFFCFDHQKERKKGRKKCSEKQTLDSEISAATGQRGAGAQE